MLLHNPYIATLIPTPQNDGNYSIFGVPRSADLPPPIIGQALPCNIPGLRV